MFSSLMSSLFVGRVENLKNIPRGVLVFLNFSRVVHILVVFF